MHEPVIDAILQIVRKDPRYRPEAYLFVFEALHAAQQAQRGQGGGSASQSPVSEGDTREERHLTGQELCQAIRLHALDQYGYMARCVLNKWGINRTGDFGEIVYNLIDADKMRKTATDRREDFDDVFNFETDLADSFRVKPLE